MIQLFFLFVYFLKTLQIKNKQTKKQQLQTLKKRDRALDKI